MKFNCAVVTVCYAMLLLMMMMMYQSWFLCCHCLIPWHCPLGASGCHSGPLHQIAPPNWLVLWTASCISRQTTCSSQSKPVWRSNLTKRTTMTTWCPKRTMPRNETMTTKKSALIHHHHHQQHCITYCQNCTIGLQISIK